MRIITERWWGKYRIPCRMQRMTVVLENVSSGIQQGKQLLQMTAKVIQTNVQIFQIVLNIQNIISRIPGQIERQQPVYLIDALGRHQPFHLEFIMSAEAFVSVLQSNFKHIGPGASKIKSGEFAIQDSVTKRDIDLSLPWESCFYPGQQVDMSMVFNIAEESGNDCPKCHEHNDDAFTEGQDVECRKCKMIYRRNLVRTLTNPYSPRDDGRRKNFDGEDEEISLFRRVRLKTSAMIPSLVIMLANLKTLSRQSLGRSPRTFRK